jgi:hypothetical protein
MRQITSGAYLMEGLRRAHVYLLTSSSLAVHSKLPAWLSRGQFVADETDRSQVKWTTARQAPR